MRFIKSWRPLENPGIKKKKRGFCKGLTGAILGITLFEFDYKNLPIKTKPVIDKRAGMARRSVLSYKFSDYLINIPSVSNRIYNCLFIPVINSIYCSVAFHF